jgi:hypothetical protein
LEEIIDDMKIFIDSLKSLKTRKEKAIEIFKKYGEKNRTSYVFNILDGKNLTNQQKKSIIYQIIKK